ncbi:MAG: DUF3108 domain-containing protein [Bryobacteraceae bacterium]
MFAALVLAAPAAVDSFTERLSYTIEWRLIHAGNMVVDSGPTSDVLKLESAGMVSALYKVDDTYQVQFDSSLCAASSLMNSKEGSRHRETTVNFDRNRNRAFLTEKDLVKNTMVSKTDVQIPNCAHEVITALKQLRRTKVEVGQSVQIPVTDGRKSAAVKVEAQEREQVKTPAGAFNAIRYEVNLLNGVVYSRKGRVFVWLTDDERRLPVQFLLRMNFPLGTVTLELEKVEHP